MSNDTVNISANSPALEGTDNVSSRFSQPWYRFFVIVLRKIRILDGTTSAAATAGTAAPLPALPAGYMTINELDGTPRKVPYYNV
jgi:hypothetical protein